ncbi:hypothetical protein [Embleya sp. NPDC020630]|uniref:hypothetical protein n=1 Tax=Embleya sp. NPDC020630 TaxID=3363979 RepID=UPI0037A703E9
MTPDRSPTAGPDFDDLVWRITRTARRTAAPTPIRLPTPQDWVALHAQSLEDTHTGDLAGPCNPPWAHCCYH